MTNSAAFQMLRVLMIRGTMRTRLNLIPDERWFGAAVILSRYLRDAGCVNIQERPSIFSTPALKWLLQDAGGQQVQQAVWFINFSAGMPAHADLCQHLAETYRLVQPFLIRTLA